MNFYTLLANELSDGYTSRLSIVEQVSHLGNLVRIIVEMQSDDVLMSGHAHCVYGMLQDVYPTTPPHLQRRRHGHLSS